MAFQLRAATDRDLPFARSLTFEAMSRYYQQYDLMWSNDGFDVAWGGRENWLICNDDVVMGFVSLSRDSRALYIRELHMLQACRGLGAVAFDRIQDQSGQEALSAQGLEHCR